MALPVITKQPENIVCNLGDTVSFTVEATDATSYQWYRGIDPIGPDSPTYEIVGATEADFRPYSVEAINDEGRVSSDNITLSKQVTDTDVPEQIIPERIERPSVRMKINGDGGIYPDVVISENAVIRAAVDLGDGNFVTLPDTYKVAHAASSGKNLIVYMVVRIVEE